MSIAFNAAVTGMKSSQAMLDVVGNNISNVNTTGFKAGRISFQELFYQTFKGAGAPTGELGGTNPLQVGFGTKIGGISSDFTQGILELTGNSTDLAISGSGFFVARDLDGSQVFTRNGNFSLDQNGNMVDPQGRRVQGWNAVNGVVNNTAVPVSLRLDTGGSVSANPSTVLNYSGNLDASAAVGDTFVSEVTVFDTLGDRHRVEVTFTKAAPAPGQGPTWTYDGELPDGTPVGSGAVVFDALGFFDEASSTINPFNVPVANGATTPLSVRPDFSGASQLATASSIAAASQDGFPAGSLVSFSVDSNGSINGTFSNGKQTVLGQVALAVFSNSEGLERAVDGYFRQSANSGEAQIGVANSGTRGGIAGGSLENSNVDLATEFTRLIVAQRAFQANSRVITTQEQLFDEVGNLVR